MGGAVFKRKGENVEVMNTIAVHYRNRKHIFWYWIECVEWVRWKFRVTPGFWLGWWHNLLRYDWWRNKYFKGKSDISWNVWITYETPQRMSFFSLPEMCPFLMSILFLKNELFNLSSSILLLIFDFIFILFSLVLIILIFIFKKDFIYSF